MTALKALILVGIPGSGKSTLLKSEFPTAQIFSADLFPGIYGDGSFHPELLPQAHQASLRGYIEALQSKAPLVACDNTNTTTAEIAPYVATAQAYGYSVEIVFVECDPVLGHARNIHGVPLKACQAMADRIKTLQEQIPPWWPSRKIG